MSDIGTLTAAASAAQDALNAAKAEQAAVAKAADDERRGRSIEWAWAYVVSYNPRQVEASAKVTDTLAALTEAVTVDLALAARLYLDVTREMAYANSLGDELVKARAILKAAGELPGVYRMGRDPVGDNAPWALTHGLVRFPPFLEFVDGVLTARRAIVGRVQSSETPETYEGKASAGLKEEALRREWIAAQEFESLLALREQWPDRFKELPPEEQASVNAYARTREAFGFDAPLPKIAGARLVDPEPPRFAPGDAVRVTLYGQEGHVPSHAPEANR
jgi:hypothetical protein